MLFAEICIHVWSMETDVCFNNKTIRDVLDEAIDVGSVDLEARTNSGQHRTEK